MRKLLFTIVLICSLMLFGGIIFPSGHVQCIGQTCGRFYSWAHGHDALWHLAVGNVSLRNWPPTSPLFAGGNLIGYNYGFDILLALGSAISLDSSFLYFKLLPIIWFALFNYLIFRLMSRFDKNILLSALTIFITFFSGSLAYIFTLMHKGTIFGSSTILSSPAIHLASNPPFAFSLLIILLTLLIVQSGRVTFRNFISLCVLLFLSFGLKFYAGFVVSWLAFGYLALNGTTFEWGKRIMRSMLFVAITALVVIFWYSPFSISNSEPIFSFAPFAVVHPITEDSGQFYMRDLTDARYFLQDNGIGPRLVAIEALNFSLYYIFHYGAKILGIFYIGYLLWKKRTMFDLIVGTLTIALLLIPILFVQRGEWWNIMQFADYGSFLLGLYTARLFFTWLHPRSWVRWLVVGILMLASSVTAIDILNTSYRTLPSSYIPAAELQLLELLKTLPEGVVGSDNWRPQSQSSALIPPLYTTRNSPYISALSAKPLFLDDLYQLKVLGTSYADRLEMLTANPCSLLAHINYFYSVDNVQTIAVYEGCPGYELKQIQQIDNFGLYEVVKKTYN